MVLWTQHHLNRFSCCLWTIYTQTLVYNPTEQNLLGNSENAWITDILSNVLHNQCTCLKLTSHLQRTMWRDILTQAYLGILVALLWFNWEKTGLSGNDHRSSEGHTLRSILKTGPHTINVLSDTWSRHITTRQGNTQRTRCEAHSYFSLLLECLLENFCSCTHGFSYNNTLSASSFHLVGWRINRRTKKTAASDVRWELSAAGQTTHIPIAPSHVLPAPSSKGLKPEHASGKAGMCVSAGWGHILVFHRPDERHHMGSSGAGPRKTINLGFSCLDLKHMHAVYSPN